MAIIAILFGGALGALTRYLLSMAINKTFIDFYVGTLFCNSLGSFIAGFLFPLIKPHSLEYLFVFIGFLGSLTTFSTFSLESLLLLQKGKYTDFAGYTFLSLSLAISFCCLGFLGGSKILNKEF